MVKYKFNKEELKQLLDYCIERYENTTDDKEKERLGLSILTYYNMYMIANDEKESQYEQKLVVIRKGLMNETKPFVDRSYLKFLLKLMNNIARTQWKHHEYKYASMRCLNNGLIKISKAFYYSLGDEEIYKLACKILNNPQIIHIVKYSNKTLHFKNFIGITNEDYTFKKVYMAVKKTNTILDMLTLNHEVMHGIDFYFREKIPSENYYGFQEVSAYAVNHLFIDFLKEMEISDKEIPKLKEKMLWLLLDLAQDTKIDLENNIKQEFGKKKMLSLKTSDIFKVISNDILESLIQIQAYVMAYGLYWQIKQNKESGIRNLKYFMSNIIPKNRIPDFSAIGLSPDVLLDLSKKIAIIEFDDEKKLIIK
ncbi:MAG: hypothetical protein GX247_05520 [Mollicutes bacterium]|nr:hypothetical protein [Mollicutes bacterium]